jgi:pyruvate dehydrogenase E1 component alpha subunit
MNFAGVFAAPVIFLCQNNQYAISTPRHRQTASETIAGKAAAYGMTGLQVDGNDLFAVLAAAEEAAERARRGEGPTLIEAVTFRIGAHTTADDPGRYRDPAEEDQWRARDPIDRLRRYLEAAGEWTPVWQQELEESAAADIEDAIARAEALEPLEDIFGAMFAAPTPQLERQRRMLEGGSHG